MAEPQSQQGFLYELETTKFLKKQGLVPPGFTPAGASHNQPDLMLLYKKQKAGCELKITATAAGSLVVKYDINNKKNPWMFNPISKDDKEKLLIQDIANSVRFFDLVHKNWHHVPLKFTPGSRLSKEDQYKKDKILFPDIKGEVSATFIEKYYNRKDTWYVNVGTHGFYLLGTSNPLKLKGVPTFGSKAKAGFRARVQYKGSGSYQFVFALDFSIPSSNKSPYNIAPVDGKSVNIIKEKAELGCFLK